MDLFKIWAYALILALYVAKSIHTALLRRAGEKKITETELGVRIARNGRIILELSYRRKNIPQESIEDI